MGRSKTGPISFLVRWFENIGFMVWNHEGLEEKD